MIDTEWRLVLEFLELDDAVYMAATCTSGLGSRLQTGELWCPHVQELSGSEPRRASKLTAVAFESVKSIVLVGLDNPSETVAIILACAQMKNLESLNLEDIDPPEAEEESAHMSVAVVRAVQRLLVCVPGLTHIDISYLNIANSKENHEKLLDVYCARKTMTHIAMKGPLLNPDEVCPLTRKLVTAIEVLNHLSVLDLRNGVLSMQALSSVCKALVQVGSLKNLSLIDMHLTATHLQILVETARKLPKLTGITLAFHPGLFSAATLETPYISPLFANQIQELNLVGSLCTQPALELLAEALRQMLQLSRLGMGNNNFSTGVERGARAVMQSLGCSTRLRSLNLGSCELGPWAVPCLCEVIMKHTGLVDVLLGQNRFGSLGVVDLLGPLSRLKHLRNVHIGHRHEEFSLDYDCYNKIIGTLGSHLNGGKAHILIDGEWR